MKKDHKDKIGAALHQRFLDNQDQDLIQQMTALYEGGNTLAQVAAAVSKPRQTVWRWLKAAGVQIRDRSHGKAGKKWTAARRAHNPAKPLRASGAPTGYDILTDRAMGNKSISKQGYVVVHTGRKSRQYEHILVAERALGRPLDKGMVVHHINCDRADNRPENLLICSIGYHLQLHARMRADPYWSQFSNPSKHHE